MTTTLTSDADSVVAAQDGPVGYASTNGGTTGGAGADNVQEYVLSEYWQDSEYDSPGDAMYELLSEHRDADASQGLVIYLDETITASDFSESKMDIKDVQNVSIPRCR